MDQTVRRPRRSSITQHLHRVFHVELSGVQGKNDSRAYPGMDKPMKCQDPSRETSRTRISCDSLNAKPPYRESEETSTGLLPSKPVKWSSAPSTFRKAFQKSKPRASMNDLLEKNGPDPFINVGKKDRRATRRLEAERVELEKRFRRLEQAERVEDCHSLKKDTRRLTKKQPLRSPSRSSSTSARESRSSRYFPSVFSSSRSGSRSRPRSVERSSSRHHSGHSYDYGLENRLSMSLPERFGAALSKELTANNSALLSTKTQSLILPQPIDGSKLAGLNLTPQDQTYENHCTGLAKDEFLDRSSFTASLKLAQKAPSIAKEDISILRPPVAATTKMKQKSHQHSTRLWESERTKDTERHSLLATSEGFPPRKPLSAKISTEKFLQARQKEFKSSPLKPQFENKEAHTSTSSRGNSVILTSTCTSSVQPQNDIGIENEETIRPPSLNAINQTRRNPQKRLYRDSNISLEDHFTEHENPQSLQCGEGSYSATSLCIDAQQHNNKDLNKINPVHLEYNNRNIGGGQHDDNFGQSSFDLSTSLSQDQPSDNHNTAGEAASYQSRTRNHYVPDERTCIPKRDLNATDTNSPSGPNLTARSMHTEVVPLQGEIDNERQTQEPHLISKVFVICCCCKFWHDMPSDVYTRLDFCRRLPTSGDTRLSSRRTTSKDPHGISTAAGVSAGLLSTDSLGRKEMSQDIKSKVQCCWCKHHMSRACCEGWTTLVHMYQRH